MRTVKQIAFDALYMQNAYDLNDVVKSFADATTVLWAEAWMRGEGAEWVNTHPVSRLYTFQLMTLSGIAYTTADPMYADAYNACRKLTRRVTPSPRAVTPFLRRKAGIVRTGNRNEH